LSSFAQTIKGKVQDGQRQPIIGASVFLEGTKQAVQTDAMGMFSFPVTEAGKYKVRVSMVGYKMLTRDLTAGTTVYNLTIEEDSKSLEDVVVVGYGTKLRREVTGSISKISAKELNDLPVQSFEGALQAKLPGVQVTTGSGIAGSGAVVRIRGVASISAGGDPLYVVDGIPITQDYFLQGNGGVNKLVRVLETPARSAAENSPGRGPKPKR
jgi:outer membrane receptor protein involved in Fe transport